MDINDIIQQAKEKAEKLEENQTIGIYDDDESLAYDEGYNRGGIAGYEQGYIDGAMAIFDLWKDCFRSCSSPWCRTYFNNFEVTGVLGNLTKKEVKE